MANKTVIYLSVSVTPQLNFKLNQKFHKVTPIIAKKLAK